MRYITEQELRDAFANGIPDRYDIPSDAMLTPAARQYLQDLRLYQSSLRIGPKVTKMGKKPEHMTHLTIGQLAPKTHPRILLRGKLDSLQADILVAQILLKERGASHLADALEEVMVLTKRILAADVTEKPLGDWQLNGMTPEQVRDASHHPDRFGSLGHVQPNTDQGLAAALLNRLRTQSREVELVAAAAFCQGGTCSREDLFLALNRLSAYLYVLQLRAVKEREGSTWNVQP